MTAIKALALHACSMVQNIECLQRQDKLIMVAEVRFFMDMAACRLADRKRNGLIGRVMKMSSFMSIIEQYQEKLYGHFVRIHTNRLLKKALTHKTRG
jgi:hypothetical protein